MAGRTGRASKLIVNRSTVLCRRLEAQILTQLGVEVAIDSAPLGGRDLAGRASAFARFTKGGMDVADARQAAGV